jgi:hypothetical protein
MGAKAPQRFYRGLLPIIGLRGYRGKLPRALRGWGYNSRFLCQPEAPE